MVQNVVAQQPQQIIVARLRHKPLSRRKPNRVIEDIDVGGRSLSYRMRYRSSPSIQPAIGRQQGGA
jgi:hypothetical protein